MATVDELQEELVRQSSRRLEVEHELIRLNELIRSLQRERGRLESASASLRSENTSLEQRLAKMEDEISDLSSSLLDEANVKVAAANRKVAAAQQLVTERDILIESQGAQLQALKVMLEAASAQYDQEDAADSSESISSYPRRRARSRQIPQHPVAQRQRSSSSRSVPGSPALNGAANTTPALQGTRPGEAFGHLSTPQQLQSSSVLSTPSRSVSDYRAASTPAAGAAFNIDLTGDLILDLDAYASPVRPLLRTDTYDFLSFLDVWGAGREPHQLRFGGLETPPWRKRKFVARLLTEEVYPAVRVEASPHMSWLQQRAFIAGILDLTMELEPVSAREQPWAQRPSHPCLMCGENRAGERYARSHWARTTPDAVPIVLDLACLARARLACELVAFLHGIAQREPTNDVVTHERAWRKCTALRERLFWSRAGGLYPEEVTEIFAHDYAAGDDDDDSVIGLPEDDASVEVGNKELRDSVADSGVAVAVASGLAQTGVTGISDASIAVPAVDAGAVTAPSDAAASAVYTDVHPAAANGNGHSDNNGYVGDNDADDDAGFYSTQPSPEPKPKQTRPRAADDSNLAASEAFAVQRGFPMDEEPGYGVDARSAASALAPEPDMNALRLTDVDAERQTRGTVTERAGVSRSSAHESAPASDVQELPGMPGGWPR